MKPFFATFYLFFFFLLSSSPPSESHRKHLLRFSPIANASISFVPSASPSEIPSNNSPLSSPSPPSKTPSNNSPLSSPTPPSKPPSNNSPVSSAAPPSEAPSNNSPMSSPTPPSEAPSNNSPLSAPTHPSPSPGPASFPGWCVAKPSVPDDLLQEAMDYACGTGGADCIEIKPGGACFLPDTVIAHASFAFNSYWQREKSHGGSCDFGGAAIVVSSDPSFEGCHFRLN